MHYVVIPTYQERGNIGKTVRAILALPVQVRLVIVDDASTDGTKEEIAELERAYPGRVLSIHRTPPRSFARSYIEGFDLALSDPNCQSVIECDADGSHPVDRIPAMIEALQTADVVVGSRYVVGGNIQGFSKDRLALSSAANWYIRLLTGLPMRDVTAGFVAYRADLLKRIPYRSITSNGYAFQIDMKWLCVKTGAKMIELPITFIDRSHGQSKLRFSTILEAFAIGWKYLIQRFTKRGARSA